MWSAGTQSEPQASRTILCRPVAAEPSCPARQMDTGPRPGGLRATSPTSAFVLAQQRRLTQSIILSQSPGYQAPQNNGWLNRTVVAAGREGGSLGVSGERCHFASHLARALVWLWMKQRSNLRWALGATPAQPLTTHTQVFSLHSSLCQKL